MKKETKEQVMTLNELAAYVNKKGGNYLIKVMMQKTEGGGEKDGKGRQ